jgi:8-amino-7-oxononanoate synthase
MSNWDAWLAVCGADLADRRLHRRLRALDPRDGLHVELDGREVVLFCSNDYLGLSMYTEVCTAFSEAAARLGAGPRGSSLVCGYTKHHEALEAELATLMRTEFALLFPTGYAANLSVLTSLSDPDTAIFSDELNHASIIDGCRMARERGASVHVYRHADEEHLEELLGSSSALRKLIVTDAVFSMDGDLAPLPEIAAAKRRHDALLVVDEAHALLVLGEEGAGAAEEFGVAGDVDVRVGTLGKAIGAQGGFLAATRTIRDHVLNRGRPYIYSTSLPLPVVAAARKALEVFRENPDLRVSLETHRDTLARVIGRCSTSAIQKLVIGGEEEALAASERLLEGGWLVPAIRPPTVPRGTSRLRITLSAAHTAEELDGLVRSLASLGLGG